jgi:uncharacterized membrane protein
MAVKVSTNAEKTPGDFMKAAALSFMLATTVAFPMIAAPDAALAARSGGRAGGSRSFSAAPRRMAAPSRMAAPARTMAAPTTVMNRNYYGGGGGVSDERNGVKFV